MTDEGLRRDLLRLIRGRTVFVSQANEGERTDLPAWFRAHPGATNELAIILDEALVEEDWKLFDRAVIVAMNAPSAVYLGTLSAVLDRHVEDISVEDVIDLLARTGDPRAVDSLERALWWQPEWDEFHGIGIKCIWALRDIGTPEARLAVRDAASTGPEEVRLWAESALEGWTS